MKQVYLSNAPTKIRLHSKINNRAASNSMLSKKYNVSKKTVVAWKNRNNFEDKATGQKQYIML
jgi:transposase